MRRKHPSLRHFVFVFSLLCSLTVSPRPAESAPGRVAAPPLRAPKIRASTVLEDLLKREKRRPRLSARGLAAYGNALLREKGFNYTFDACDILKANGWDGESSPSPTGKLMTYPYRLTRADGRAVTFDILSSDDEGGGMCGECFFEIPARRVTKTEMVVLADGEWQRLRRPKEFVIDEASLVDSRLKNVLRTWQMPFETVPVGVSADGSKLYVDFYEGLAPDALLLELSEGGTVRFVARADAGLRGAGEWIEDFPKDPRNDYLSYVRFRAGGKTYVVKFTGPCT